MLDVSQKRVVLIASLIGAILLVGYMGKHDQQAPRIESEYKTEYSPPSERNSSVGSNGAVVTAAASGKPKSGDHKSGEHAGDGRDEGTEFWPALFGYRLKITDTLLVLFTALLFAATIYLYRATRDLVHGAEETAKRQLRAYVCLAELKVIPPDQVVQGSRLSTRMRNTGMTPAASVTLKAIAARAAPTSDVDKLTSWGIEIHPQMIYPGKSYTTKDILDETVVGNVRTVERFFVHGYIDYRDVFGDMWRTRFSWEYEPADHEFYPCERYNDEKYLGKVAPS